jgi:hypothetical protein
MRASAVAYAIVSVLLLPSTFGFDTISGLLHPVAAERRKLRPRLPAVDPIRPRRLQLEVGPTLEQVNHARRLLSQLERQWHSNTEVTPFEAPTSAEGEPEVCTMDWIPPAMGQLDISEVMHGRAAMMSYNVAAHGLLSVLTSCTAITFENALQQSNSHCKLT